MLDLLGLPYTHVGPTVRPGWVYFVAAPEVRRIKIGSASGHPSKRLRGLRQSSPLDIQPIGLLKGSRRVEFDLHALFHYTRVRYEWFEADVWLARFISSVAQPWSAANAADLRLEVPMEDATKVVEDTLATIEEWKSSVHKHFLNKSERHQRRPDHPVSWFTRDRLPLDTPPREVLKRLKCVAPYETY